MSSEIRGAPQSQGVSTGTPRAASAHKGRIAVAVCLALIGMVGNRRIGDADPTRCVVAGQVLYDGVPVESGSIQFIPTGADGGPTAGAAIKAGAYRTPRGKGPKRGPHRVEITAYRPGKPQPSPKTAGSPNGETVSGGLSGAGGSPAGGNATMEMFILSKFNTMSELTLDVGPGTNAKDFELKSR